MCFAVALMLETSLSPLQSVVRELGGGLLARGQLSNPVRPGEPFFRGQLSRDKLRAEPLPLQELLLSKVELDGSCDFGEWLRPLLLPLTRRIHFITVSTLDSCSRSGRA